MFKVVHLATGEIRTVYEKNGQYFLLWNVEQEAWEYDHMDNYKPIEASVCAASPA